MPIYEFKCNHCGDVFEHLIFSSDGDETACPTCGDEDTCRLMSSFSSISSKFSECPSDGMSAACPPSCSPATSGFSWAWASTAVSCALWRVSDNEFVKTGGRIHLQPEIFIRNLLEGVTVWTFCWSYCSLGSGWCSRRTSCPNSVSPPEWGAVAGPATKKNQ